MDQYQSFLMFRLPLSVSANGPPNVYMIPTTSPSFTLVSTISPSTNIPLPPIYPIHQSDFIEPQVHHFSEQISMEQHLGSMSENDLAFFWHNIWIPVQADSTEEFEILLGALEEIVLNDSIDFAVE